MSRQSSCGETSRSNERNSAIAVSRWNAIRSSIFVSSSDQRPLSHLVSKKNPKLKAQKKWRVVGEAGLEMQIENATFPSDGSDYISSLVMASPKCMRALFHRVGAAGPLNQKSSGDYNLEETHQI
ncbi:hypothetical protein MUK42_17123 [Musa troglodytarum]|uniref:Uncharacterized protein n=1 Tax=Musa troglodytarum TaxID=320322 RepID=A0A9E7KQV1_9LILI|nr:hypothetical protein MUK42_17123 [Musa troglodytarum]